MEGQEVKIVGDENIWTIYAKYTNYFKDYYILRRIESTQFSSRSVTKHCLCSKIKQII